MNIEKLQGNCGSANHCGRAFEFLCFDPFCKIRGLFCMLCVKKYHSNCSSNFLVAKDDYHNFISLTKASCSTDVFKERVNTIFNNKIKEVIKTIEGFRDHFLSTIKEVESFDDFIDPQKLESINRNYNVAFDARINKITLKPKFYMKEEEFERRLSAFEKSIQTKIEHFQRDFERLEFPFSNSCGAESFKAHPLISLEPFDKGLKIGIAEDKPNTEPTSALYNYPLTTKALFRVTIDSVSKRDRFFDFGIVNKTLKEDIEKNKYIFPHAQINHHSYFFSGNGTHRSLANKNDERAEGDGFIGRLIKGNEFFIEFEPGIGIHIYNAQGTINLFGDICGDKADYYLCLRFTHREDSCVLIREK